MPVNPYIDDTDTLYPPPYTPPFFPAARPPYLPPASAPAAPPVNGAGNGVGPGPVNAPDATAGPSPAPSPTDPLQAQKQRYSQAQQRLQQVQAGQPQIPKPKWWQQLGAVGAGALAGAENAGGHSRVPMDAQAMEQGILAPGYGLKQRIYQQQLAQAQGDVAEAEKALKTGSTVGEEQARSGYYADLPQARRDAAKTAADQRAQTGKDLADEKAAAGRRDTFNKIIKDRSIGMQLATDPVPAGYQPLPDMDDPKYVHLLAPATMQISPELAPYARGRKAGDAVPYSEFLKAQEAAQKEEVQSHKPNLFTSVSLAIKAAGGDPNDPGSITQDVAEKAAAHLKPQMPGIDLTPDAIQFWARAAAQGVPLPSMGMGASGAKARQEIINAAPGASGGSSLVANRAVARGNTTSLQNVVRMRDAVVSFENTASQNLDLFLNQAKKIVDTGSPWINQPIRDVAKSGLGSADLAAYDAARQVALTEIAKVVNNPSMTSVLSDTARKEVMSLLPERATLKQIYRVAQVLKSDMANRKGSLDKQIREIEGRLGQTPGQQSGTTPASPGPDIQNLRQKYQY